MLVPEEVEEEGKEDEDFTNDNNATGIFILLGAEDTDIDDNKVKDLKEVLLPTCNPRYHPRREHPSKSLQPCQEGSSGHK